MRARRDDLPKWARKDVESCAECRKHDTTVFLCGWHENVAAAAHVVQRVVDQERDQ